MNTFYHSLAFENNGIKKHRQDILLKDLLALQQQGLRLSTQKANLSMLAKIEAYAGYDISIKNINSGFCIGFAHYLPHSSWHPRPCL